MSRYEYELREKQKRDAFLSLMRVFLDAHGTKNTDAEKLIDYAVSKTGEGFNYYGVRWTAERDRIQCSHSWEGHSFFDDGGGIEGEIDWTLSYVGTEGNYPIENEKLNDLSCYAFRSTIGGIEDTFFCKNPFGLLGIYRIDYSGYEKHTD